MLSLKNTVYYKTLLFLALLLFLQGFLFQNLLLPFAGLGVLCFLIYTKTSFQQKDTSKILVKRKILEKQIFVNHPVNIKTEVTNLSHQLLHLSIKDELPENAILTKGENIQKKILRANEKTVLEYQIQFISRGNQRFKHISLEINDIWGLFQIKFEKFLPSIILAHSDPAEIQKAKRISEREHIEISSPSVIGLENVYEMDGIREYQPGDRLKDIDWKATSRLEKMMTKLFEKKQLVPTFILLDCTRGMRRSIQDGDSKIDHASNLAVQLTKILQSLNHPVGLVAFDEYKIVENMAATADYHRVFRALSKLPGVIKTESYPIIDRGIDGGKKSGSKEEQYFLSTVFPFLAGGKRKIRHSLESTGVYEAFRFLTMDHRNKHLIVITDLESNIQSTYKSLNMAYSRNFNIWLLTPFTPYYSLKKQDINVEELEKIYPWFKRRKKALARLKKMNLEIVELTPDMESVKIIERIKGKTGREK